MSGGPGQNRSTTNKCDGKIQRRQLETCVSNGASQVTHIPIMPRWRLGPQGPPGSRVGGGETEEEMPFNLL